QRRFAGDRGTGCERRDVGRDLVDLGLRVLRWVALGLRTRLGERHPAGAELEVDGGRAHPDQAGGLVAALCLQAVTGRAAGEEESTPEPDLLAARGGLRGAAAGSQG